MRVERLSPTRTETAWVSVAVHATHTAALLYTAAEQ